MEVTYITTTYVDNIKKQQTQRLEFVQDEDTENEVINLYPQMKYQTIEGFGGAITDSAGYMFSLMNEAQKEELLRGYFGSEGMKYHLVRIPIDSCDFSLEHYEADGDENDEKFEKFSFERVEKYILPMLDAAEKVHGSKLPIMLTPWSPPVYMKTNGDRNHGGKLKPEYRKRWAEYLCRYIQEYRKRGYLVTKLSLQNEPKAIQTWDSCVFTAEEEKEFLRDYMWPSMKAHGLDDIGIYLWDHNKERVFEWAEAIIDDETTKMVEGMAFHWYSGDHFETLRMIGECFPDKKLMLSEACIEFSKFSADDYLGNAQKYAHDMIGNLNEGMHTFVDWNLLLNQEGGPNHVKNFCDAPYLFDTEKKELKERNIREYLWHFCHFIEKGAVRIGVSKYTDQLEVTAFEKDGQITFVVLNRTGEERSAYIRLWNQSVKIMVKPNSISSGVIR